MTDKKPTDNEIIKAFEYWKEFDKEIDVLLKRYPEDKADLLEQREIVRITLDALDLINRQKKELEKNENIIRLADKTIETANAEIERLEEEVELLHSDYTYKFVKEKAKSEAYKEFAERLKEKAVNLRYIGEHVSVDDIDNLLKEIVGEDK